MINKPAVVVEMPVEMTCSPNGVNFPVTPKSKAIVGKLREKSNEKKVIAVEQGKAEDTVIRIAGRQIDVDENGEEKKGDGIADKETVAIEREI